MVVGHWDNQNALTHLQKFSFENHWNLHCIFEIAQDIFISF